MRRVLFFAIGLVVGLMVDMLPHAIEVALNANLCRESCPPSLRSGSLIVFAALPVIWGVLLATVVGRRNWKRIVGAAAFCSLTIILLLTLLLRAAQ